MRRIHVILLMLVPFSAAAWAQSSRVVLPQSGPAPAGTNAEDMVARVMSFDRDTDGKVAKDELIERMKDLVARGDANGDGALDGNEIRTLARTSVSTSGGGGFPMYQLPAESWFPNRSHIEGALSDLKLESDAHARALAVVETHQQHLEPIAQAAADHLLREMESILTPEQLDDFKMSLNGQRTRQVLSIRGPAGAASGSDAVVANAVLLSVTEAAVSGNFRRIVRFVANDLGRRIDQFGLPATKSREAHAALASYKANLDDLGQAERAGLVEQMKDILNEEERDDFRAALERRSAVPMGEVVVGVVGVVRGGVISVAPPIAAPSGTR